MSSIIKIATSLACLAAVAVAKPINAGSLSRREWTDCSAGTVFYSCANGYRGCFEKDPCALPPIAAATTTIPTPPSPTTVETITTTPPATTCQSGSVWQPTMYNLFPTQPDFSQTSVSYLEVQVRGTEPQLEQVAVFQGIPAGAKTCTLSWAQASEAERVFVVDDSGYTSVLPLTGFPAAGSPVSSASVKPFEPADAAAAKHPDFTFWDKQSKDAATHTAGVVACAEEMYFKVAIDTTNGDGHVYLEQDAKNGFYISYTC
ncbi:hypothetical protein F4781DRAFT_407587 [Annulohypoxylon bovei var. microspora]|nr:hypothetical protein F4781DRAFT_407587 [Annulohypoxylon bovei var. microspora]